MTQNVNSDSGSKIKCFIRNKTGHRVNEIFFATLTHFIQYKVDAVEKSVNGILMDAYPRDSVIKYNATHVIVCYAGIVTCNLETNWNRTISGQWAS